MTPRAATEQTFLERFFARNRGPLLVSPAILVLVMMNIFPLLWSFGLSFYNYRANRMKEPVFIRPAFDQKQQLVRINCP